MFGESSYAYFRRKSVQTIAQGLARTVVLIQVLGLIFIYRKWALVDAVQFHLIASYLVLFFVGFGNFAFSIKLDDGHGESSIFNPDQVPFVKKYFTHLHFPTAAQFVASLLTGLSGVGLCLGVIGLLFGWELNAILFFFHFLLSMVMSAKLDPVTHVYRKAAKGNQSYYIEAVQIEEVKAICLELAKVEETRPVEALRTLR
jgi:hypothetical protein